MSISVTAGRAMGKPERVARRVRGWLPAVLALAFLLGALPAAAQNSCNAAIQLSATYNAPPNVANTVDTIRLHLTTGLIQGGTLNQITIPKVRFFLDCMAGSIISDNCTDDGAVIQYEGDATITTDCQMGGNPITWNTGHAIGPNPATLVFTPSVPLILPAQSQGCSIWFQVRKLSHSNDGTPLLIEEMAHFGDDGVKATCDQPESPLVAFGTGTISLDFVGKPTIPAPTMSGGLMVLLAGLLGSFGVLALRRTNTTNPHA